MQPLPHQETQYLNLVQEILDTGDEEETRNGRTLSVFGRQMRFSLAEGTLPCLTTKKVLWRTCFEELRWFLRGSTDIRELHAVGVHIWDGDCPPGQTSLGPIYGAQWRRFGGDPQCDQIAAVVAALNQAKDPAFPVSRRILLTAWNPAQLSEMALPPCHVLAQFNVRQRRFLSCALYQRSGDVGLGVPFNILSYAFLTHLLAAHCGLEAEEFVHFLGNAHIYTEHEVPLREQIQRSPLPFPRIRIRHRRESLEDYTADDVEWLEPYRHHEFLRMTLRN